MLIGFNEDVSLKNDDWFLKTTLKPTKCPFKECLKLTADKYQHALHAALKYDPLKPFSREQAPRLNPSKELQVDGGRLEHCALSTEAAAVHPTSHSVVVCKVPNQIPSNYINIRSFMYILPQNRKIQNQVYTPVWKYLAPIYGIYPCSEPRQNPGSRVGRFYPPANSLGNPWIVIL